MRLLDVINTPWALAPEKLLEIQAIYETHLRGEKIDIKAVEARLGQPLVNEPKPYQVVNGVALVPMIGVLAKRANMFTQISGGTSTQMIGDWLDQAAADQQVTSIILEIDSPGGQVDGVQQLAGKVQSIRAAGKTVVAWINGVGASGAYWVASAAERVLVSDSTTMVGSIGVVATHVDVSQREQQMGVKTTEITAGKYKRISSSYAPLSEEGRATIQQQVDAIYSVFVGDVSANRGVGVEEVLNRMADGRVFIGQAAQEAGLVDGVSTLSALIQELQPRPGAGRMSSNKSSKGIQTMDMTTLKTEHPDLYKAVFDEGQTAGAQQGAAQERARIAAIDDTALAGHEALTQQAKAEGWTVEKYSHAVITAERNQRKAAAADLNADAPKPAADAPPAAQTSAVYKTPAGFAVNSERAQLHNKALAYSKEHNVSYTQALTAVQ